MSIIDCHMHMAVAEFCLGTVADMPFDISNSVENTIALLNQYHIKQAVVFPIPHALFDVKRSNAYILEAYQRYPTRLIPFCRIDEELEQNLSKGFRGVKIHLLYEELEIKTIRKELQIIEDAGVPLVLHALFKDKVKQVKSILRIAPNLKLILAHMGRGHLYTGEQVVENAIGLKPYPNVYMDTSTVGDFKAVVNACEILGYDRVLYGSDYPFGRNMFKEAYKYDADLRQISCMLSPTRAEMLLYSNITQLLRQGSSEGIQIRRIRKADSGEVFMMLNQLSETDKKYLALSSKHSLIRQQIRDERHCYVALLHGKIVGFLRESGRPEGRSLLEELVVAPACRKQGVATALLRYYHNAFTKNLAKTNAANHVMIHLLKKHGYTAENPDAPRIINWSRNVIS